MTENMKKFLEALSKDMGLQEKAKSASKEELVALAKELGIILTEADFEGPEGELSEKELAGVAGGRCICAMYGGGGGTDAKDDNTYGCACFVYGQGGDGRANDANCICVQAGGGDDTTQYM